MKIYLLVLILILISSCSPKINTYILEKKPPLLDKEKIIVFQKDQKKPENSKIIAMTNLQNSGFTEDCEYDTLLALAINEVRKAGGNALKITAHILPHYKNPCHRIKADILLVDVSEFVKIDDKKKDSITNRNQKGYIYENVTNKNKIEKSNFLVITNFALANRLGRAAEGLSSEQGKYIKKLNSGTSYEISAYYLKDDVTGYGLIYNIYRSKGILRNQPFVLKDQTTITGDFSDDITISYIGPSCIYSDNQKTKVGEANALISLGFINYQNNSNIIGVPIKISGYNLGAIAGMGYHFRITPKILFGGQVNFIGGVLKKFKFTYPDGTSETIKLNEKELENLWRIDLAIGAKFRF